MLGQRALNLNSLTINNFSPLTLFFYSFLNENPKVKNQSIPTLMIFFPFSFVVARNSEKSKLEDVKTANARIFEYLIVGFIILAEVKSIGDYDIHRI